MNCDARPPQVRDTALGQLSDGQGFVLLAAWPQRAETLAWLTPAVQAAWVPPGDPELLTVAAGGEGECTKNTKIS